MNHQPNTPASLNEAVAWLNPETGDCVSAKCKTDWASAYGENAGNVYSTALIAAPGAAIAARDYPDLPMFSCLCSDGPGGGTCGVYSEADMKAFVDADRVARERERRNEEIRFPYWICAFDGIKPDPFILCDDKDTAKHLAKKLRSSLWGVAENKWLVKS